jgi:hypothetical protein
LILKGTAVEREGQRPRIVTTAWSGLCLPKLKIAGFVKAGDYLVYKCKEGVGPEEEVKSVVGSSAASASLMGQMWRLIVISK